MLLGLLLVLAQLDNTCGAANSLLAHPDTATERATQAVFGLEPRDYTGAEQDVLVADMLVALWAGAPPRTGVDARNYAQRTVLRAAQERGSVAPMTWPDGWAGVVAVRMADCRARGY